MIRSNWKQKDMTASPDKYPQGRFKDKPCRWCKNTFKPLAPSHLYCSDECKDKGLSDNYYRNQYGIGVNEVEQILERQNYVCAICEEVGFKMNEGVKLTLNLDHCHDTGYVRGLLCHNCNRALGLMKDDVTRLNRAINYLKGATTIPEGSRGKCSEAHNSES